jgi:hypothetical protein
MNIQFSGIRFFKIANPPKPGANYQTGMIELDSSLSKEAQQQKLDAIEQERVDYESRLKAADKSFETKVEQQMTEIAAPNLNQPGYLMTGMPAYSSSKGFGTLVLDGVDLTQFLVDTHQLTQRNVSAYVDAAKRSRNGERLSLKNSPCTLIESLTNTPQVLDWSSAAYFQDGIKYPTDRAREEVIRKYVDRAELIDITV